MGGTMDRIDSIDLDIDSVDADGEIPMRTVTSLHIEGDFVEAIGKYLADEDNFRLVLVIDDATIEDLHEKLGKYIGESRY
jgi:hypothetical protein